MAMLAWPARVTVATPEGWTEPVVFRHKTLGHGTAWTGIPLALPAGTYELSTAGSSRDVTILRGGDYTLPASAGSWVQLGPMEGVSRSGKIALTVTARGVGVHELELRVYNGQPIVTSRNVHLTAGIEQEIQWEFETANPQSPWVAVVVPDRDMVAKAEAHGTL
jgi:hypothetical protein